MIFAGNFNINCSLLESETLINFSEKKFSLKMIESRNYHTTQSMINSLCLMSHVRVTLFFFSLLRPLLFFSRRLCSSSIHLFWDLSFSLYVQSASTRVNWEICPGPYSHFGTSRKIFYQFEDLSYSAYHYFLTLNWNLNIELTSTKKNSKIKSYFVVGPTIMSDRSCV